jgi:hypothetical protein
MKYGQPRVAVLHETFPKISIRIQKAIIYGVFRKLSLSSKVFPRLSVLTVAAWCAGLSKTKLFLASAITFWEKMSVAKPERGGEKNNPPEVMEDSLI